MPPVQNESLRNTWKNKAKYINDIINHVYRPAACMFKADKDCFMTAITLDPFSNFGEAAASMSPL